MIGITSLQSRQIMPVRLFSSQGDSIQVPDWIIDSSEMITNLRQDFNDIEDITLRTSLSTTDLRDRLIVTDYLLCPDLIIDSGIKLINRTARGAYCLTDLHRNIVLNNRLLTSLALFHNLIPVKNIPDIPDNPKLSLLINVLHKEFKQSITNRPYESFLLQYLTDTIDLDENWCTLMEVASIITRLWKSGYSLKALAFLIKGVVLSSVIDQYTYGNLNNEQLFQLISQLARFNLEPSKTGESKPRRGYIKSFAVGLLKVITIMGDHRSRYTDLVIRTHLDAMIGGNKTVNWIVIRVLNIALSLKLQCVKKMLRIIDQHHSELSLLPILDAMLTHNYTDFEGILELKNDCWAPFDDIRTIDLSDGQSRDEFIRTLVIGYRHYEVINPSYPKDILAAAILGSNSDVAMQIINWFSPDMVAIKATGRQLVHSAIIRKMSGLGQSSIIQAIDSSYRGVDSLQVRIQLIDHGVESLKKMGERFFKWVIQHMSNVDVNSLAIILNDNGDMFLGQSTARMILGWRSM